MQSLSAFAGCVLEMLESVDPFPTSFRSKPDSCDFFLPPPTFLKRWCLALGHELLQAEGQLADTDLLLSTLQAEGAKVEKESEELAERFLEGRFALEVFLEQYNEQRKLAHLRRVRIEKLQEILSQPRAAPAQPVQPSPTLPQRPPPPVPCPTAAPPLPYDPNPGAAGVPRQGGPTYPPTSTAPPQYYPRPIQPLQPPYPVQGQFAASQPPYPLYPMATYVYGPSGPPQVPPRPGYKTPQPPYHMPQPY
ncbi:hypothetical protein chiPu_0022148 [Chiloscyllium punctatum]|uniref:VPS37 C-terminal domain-containing protein n=1 Tax=Chiloscyllium punctatum TaxID=137246 RepID=A0A401RL71_CHIPU|nr:hypothetical protein [Chiloscyllium punctatum]